MLYIREINLHSDNPAARLLKILEAGRKQQPNEKCRNVWHKLLGVDNNNHALLMSRLGKVMELPEQIITNIQDYYPNQGNTYKHWSQKVNAAFMQQNLNGQWNDFNKHIDSHTIDYLSMTADLLDVKVSTQLLPESKIEDIREKVDDLIKEAIESDIDTEFKGYITRYLRKIIIAIDEYNISGAIPIAESIESTFGHAFLDKNYHENLSKTEYGKKVITVLGAVASVVTIAVGLPQLPDTFQYLLGGPKK